MSPRLVTSTALASSPISLALPTFLHIEDVGESVKLVDPGLMSKAEIKSNVPTLVYLSGKDLDWDCCVPFVPFVFRGGKVIKPLLLGHAFPDFITATERTTGQLSVGRLKVRQVELTCSSKRSRIWHQRRAKRSRRRDRGVLCYPCDREACRPNDKSKGRHQHRDRTCQSTK